MAKPIRQVAVLATFHTPQAVAMARRLIAWLERRGVGVRLRSDTAVRLGPDERGCHIR